MLEDLRRIYSSFADRLSQEIYLKRTNYSISGTAEYINDLLYITVRKDPVWISFCNRVKELLNNSPVLFGAGIWGDTILREFRDIPWNCIIDNGSDQTEKNGIPVIRASDFLNAYNGENIVISSYKNKDAMMSQCIESGVPRENIIDAADIIYRLTEGRIYFDDDLPIHPGKGVFIDGGCFDGSDSRRFMDKYHGECLCFEPDTQNIEKIQNRLKGYEQAYRIIPKALWSTEGKLSFSSEGGQGSHIDEGNDPDHSVAAASIDSESADKCVAMIKMDIEGAELEALHGAEKTIKRDRPILAVSVYHRPEDIIVIPEYILSIDNGYKLYLRHYSFSWYDTVLYALPGEIVG